jgi:hypothetical protein
MRLTGLLALLLFFLIVFFAAPAASNAQTAQAPAATSNSNGLLPENAAQSEPLQPATDAPMLDRPLVLRQPLMDHGGDMVLRDYERDGVCYTMRTYVMAREDKDSDVTRMARYRKCLPSSKVDLKTAIAPIK